MITVSFDQIVQALAPIAWGAPTSSGELAPREGQLTGRVVHDSRKVQPGDLYLALRGETHDGHDFIAAAIKQGATCAIVSQEFVDELAGSDGLNDTVIFVVADTQLALGQLAHLVLSQAPDVLVVAVTGSSGKTSAKDLMAQIFAPHGPTIAPPGSFNNEIGLPMTVLEVDQDTKYLILEMGARGMGHIKTLTDIAKPDIGVVLNVGSAHAGEFGSIDGTRQAKQELVEALDSDGIAVLNADDPNVAAMAEAVRGRILSFGGSHAADVSAENVTLDELARPSFDLVVQAGVSTREPDGVRLAVDLPLAGAHSALNAAAASAAALAAGIPASAVAKSLAGVTVLSPGRMNVIEANDGLIVIDDSYNANVESMLAGLKALAQAGRERTTWAILGEMRELGDSSVMAHDEVGRAVVRLGIDNLIVVGQNARPMFLAAAAEGFYNGEARFADTIEDAERIFDEHGRSDDIVFVKASRAAGLDKLVTALVSTHGGQASSK